MMNKNKYGMFISVIRKVLNSKDEYEKGKKIK